MHLLRYMKSAFGYSDRSGLRHLNIGCALSLQQCIAVGVSFLSGFVPVASVPIFDCSYVRSDENALQRTNEVASKLRPQTKGWLEFRGPGGDGKVSDTHLPIEWSEEKNVRWFSKVDGLGWSSPIVVGNVIYLSTAVAGEPSTTNDDATEDSSKRPYELKLIALDVESGKQLFAKSLFEQPVDAPEIHGKNSHASPTPIVSDNRIYVHFGHMGTACCDLNGNIVWKNSEHKYAPRHGNGGSPIFCDELLIMTCDGNDEGFTFALDTFDGHEVWRTPRGVSTERTFSFCTPTIIEHEGRRQIISPGSDIIQSLDPKSGEVIWFANYSGFSVVPKPLYSHGLVFWSTGFGESTALAIDPSGTGDVTDSNIKWKFKSQNVPQTPSYVIYEDQLIMASDGGVATGLDVMTGKELWKKRLGGNYSASPLLSGSMIYFQSEQGESSVYDLNTTNNGKTAPQSIAQSTLPGRIFASYAIYQNDLLIRNEHGIYRIGE